MSTANRCFKPWCGIDGKACVDCAAVGQHCKKHCSACEGMDHHWMPDSDDEINDGEPFMVCKHCSVTRAMLDNEGGGE